MLFDDWNMLMRYDHKEVLITGAGSGIGKAMATMFAKQGALVTVADTNKTTALATVEEIISDGGQAKAAFCDVSKLSDVQNMLSQLQRLDVLINNAGVAHIGNAVSTSTEDIDRIININIKGVYHLMHSVIPIMQRNGGGVILNVASIAAWVGLQDRFAYSMSKGAVASMTLSTARDFIKDNIRCNSISPARVHTPFVDGFLQKNYGGNEADMFQKLSASQPIGRMAKPEEIAVLALYLCSEEASFITGCDYPIDGGFIKLNM